MKIRNEAEASMAFIRSLLEKMFALKYVYLISVILFVAIAYLINKYSQKVYQLNTTIGPVEDTRSSVLVSNDMFRGSGSVYSSGSRLEDVVNNLSSFALISKTISNLNLEIGYFKETNLLFKKYSEIYQQSPFIINIDKSHIQTINTRFNIYILSDSTFRLTCSSREAALYNYIDNELIAENQVLDIDIKCKFREMITNNFFRFSVTQNSPYFTYALPRKEKFYVEMYHPEEMTKAYLKSFKIEPVSWMASIINIQFASTNLKKSLIFLNKYVNLFLEENLSKKNQMAVNTINYIDKQISEMSDSLVQSESNLKNYRSSNQVMDISFQGQRLYEELAQIEQQRSNIELQTRYYNYVLNYFKTNQDVSGVTPPSSSSITDPILNKLVADLNTLGSEKSAIPNSGEKNLFSAQIDAKIKTQKQYIIDNVTNNLNTLNLTLNELNYKYEKISGDMANLPKKEMNMVNIKRKFDLNNTLYTYLLQKRAESAITLSSNYPDYEVLEPAREITSKIIKPKILMNYMLSIFLAFFFPTLFLITREFLNDKIGSIYDIERLSDRSIFGTIFNNPKKYEAVVSESPGSAIAESFRNLRSSLLLKLRSDKSKVIFVTSSQPQDGKSFISLNLAASIASVGFKTVILDCDLRRPVLNQKFDNDNSTGISSYMTKIATVNDIITETKIQNLSFVAAGPLLPNPSELIGAGVLDELFEYLKSNFDFIIIDTPPVGLVSDSIQLVKYASIILLVTRFNSTKKATLENAVETLLSNKIENFEIVLNDLNLERSPYSNFKGYYQKG